MIFSTIREKVQNMLGLNQTIEQALNISSNVNSKMSKAIELWTLLYEDNAPWLHTPDESNPSRVASLGLPAYIASEKARMAVIELQSEVTAPTSVTESANPEYFVPTKDEMGNIRVSGQSKTIIKETPLSPTARAEFINKAYQRKLISKIRTQLEYGIAKGSLIIKPYVVKARIQSIAGDDSVAEEDKYDFEFDFVQADCFYPFAFDSSGRITEVAFLQTKVTSDKIYTRLEYHKLQGTEVHITNKAFETENIATNNIIFNSNAFLGKEINLTDIPEWSNLPPHAIVRNVDRLLFGYFKMPDANTIDPHSPLGISGFARAISLIEEADKQYSRLLWEYEGGELAIDIDRDALTDVSDYKGGTHSVMGHLQQRLYRPIDLGESNTYQPYAPALRDTSLINGLNNILMRIEDVCALSRGTISEVASEARTATELKILKQRSYSSNGEIQASLEDALRDVVYAMDVYCTTYNIVNDVVKKPNGAIDPSKIGKVDVSFTWDDSILVDADSELQKRLTLLSNGLTSKVELRMWYFGESMAQAKDALNKITEESQQAIESNMLVSSQLGKEIGSGDTDNKKDEPDKPSEDTNPRLSEQKKLKNLKQSGQL